MMDNEEAKICDYCADGFHCEWWCKGKSFEPKHKIVEALEKQTPKPVTINFVPDFRGNYHYDGRPAYTVVQCSVCGNRLRLTKKKDDYCSKCGNRVDWSEVAKLEQSRKAEKYCF